MIDGLPVKIELADGSNAGSIPVGSLNAVPRGRILWDLVDREGTVLMEGLSSSTLDALIKIASFADISDFRAAAPMRFSN